MSDPRKKALIEALTTKATVSWLSLVAPFIKTPGLIVSQAKSRTPDAEARLAKVVEAAAKTLRYDHGPDCGSCQRNRKELLTALAAAQPEEESR